MYYRTYSGSQPFRTNHFQNVLQPTTQAKNVDYLNKFLEL
jgi:hypothetical protein